MSVCPYVRLSVRMSVTPFQNLWYIYPRRIYWSTIGLVKLHIGLYFRPYFDKSWTGAKWQTWANLDFFHDERSVTPLSGGTCPNFGDSWRIKLLNDKVHMTVVPGDGGRWCGKIFFHRILPPQFILMNFFKNHEYVCVQNLQEVTWEWLQVMGEDDVSGAKLSKFFKVVFWSLSGQKWILEWVKPLKNITMSPRSSWDLNFLLLPV